ncbi:MAG: hypothetical protein NTY94_10135 [Alphaproteobacteria bacterium]|nr:hypothetical protein [Alphaproteobacteria bacterium]
MRHAFTTIGLLAVVLAAALNLRGAMPPLQDFNEWIYQGWLVGQILRGEDVAFALKPWPVPNAAAQTILGLFNLALGPREAGIAYLTLYLAGMTWLAIAIARAQGRFDPATFLLALLIGGLNSPYWDGYANSQLGLALYLVHVLRRQRMATTPAWDLAMGLALFFCHAVMLAVFALHVLLDGLRQRQFLRAALCLSPPFALLAWYVLRDTSYGEHIPPFGTNLIEFLAYKAYTAAKMGPYQNFILGGIGDADRTPHLYWSGVATNLLFAGVVLLPLALALLDRLRKGDRSPSLLTALACLGGYMVLPSALFGVVNVGERLLLPAVLVMLALCPDPWNMRRLGAGIAALAPLTLLHLHLGLPADPPSGTIDHLAAHDPAQRYRVLFWHRPFYFQSQFNAAQRGEPVPLGFTTSIVRSVAGPAVAR